MNHAFWKMCAIFAISIFIIRLLSVESTRVPKEPSRFVVTASANQTYPFDDISNSYAKQKIVELHNRGIIKGINEGQFLPNKSITRAEFISMLGRALEIEPINSNIPIFRDVPKHSWAFGWVQSGAMLGIINGKDPTTFVPDATITREEAAALLVRALQTDVSNYSTQDFRDAAIASPWARSSIQTAQQLGLMRGYQGNFRPKDPITRQETAVVLHSVLANPEWLKTDDKLPDGEVHLGWHYGITGDEYIKRVAKSGVINTMSPRWFFLNADGSFTQDIDASVLDWAKKNGKKVWPLVGNRFDREATHHLLSSLKMRTAAVNQLVTYAKSYKFHGINLDFENIDPIDRANYSAFVAELAAALHKENILLSVDVPVDVGTDWSEPYDYQVLGRHADYIVIMGYDQHWKGGPSAGSVSSISWLVKSVDDMIKRVPSKKVIVGLPLYTRDWYSKNGKITADDITLAQSNQLLTANKANVKWDSSVSQYVASYKRDGLTHTIWVEDSRSLNVKYQTIRKKNVAGFAYWYVGGETPDVWQTIRNTMKHKSK